MSALLSFLGGSVFRMIWGELAAWLTARQEHTFELARMDKQGEMEDKRAERMARGLTLQAELGVKTIEVQAEAAQQQADALAFLEGVKATAIVTGVRWVDAWNATIRPGVATWAIVMLTLEGLGWLAALGGAKDLSDGTRQVIYAALGLYLADRTLAKRGK